MDVIITLPETGTFTIFTQQPDATAATPIAHLNSWVVTQVPSGVPSFAVPVYIPLTAPAPELASRVSKLSSLHIVTDGFPIYTPDGNSNNTLSSYNNKTPPAGDGAVTYYVPYRLPTTVAYGALNEIVSRLAQPISTTETSASIAAATALSSTLSANPAASATPVASPSATEASDGKARVLKADALRQSVGGSFGALLVGIAGTLLVLWCLQRRGNRTIARRSSPVTRNDGAVTHGPSSTSKKMHVLDIPANIDGWQKHLPQEKDEGTISRTIKAVFDQVQMYIEDYYNDKSGNMDQSAIAALGRVSTAELTNMLIKSSKCTSTLEAILVRWIVHRFSLRSDAGDSFLPFEYTRIPEQNGWHMESDDDDNGHVRESKNGFSQAFSQWRVLTAFLHPNPRADRDFTKQLDVKIDHGVRALTDAFSPWEKQNRSIDNRKESLRGILQSASEAGVLLFAQPSTFVFEWSTRESTLTVSPAVIKRLDEFARPLPKPETFVAARRVSV